MAKITTITNPLTGQPAQVDQLDHTAQQIDDGLNIARGVSNPNLLENWYFGNPVDQRGGYVVPPGTTYYSKTDGATLSGETGVTSGYVAVTSFMNAYIARITIGETEYYVNHSAAVRGYTGAGYGIDRWKADANVTTTVIDGGIRVEHSADSSYRYFGQNLPPEIIPSLAGKKVTWSILVGKINTGAARAYVYVGSSTIGMINPLVAGINTITFTMPNTLTASTAVQVRIQLMGVASIDVVAAKLELGSQQTLAHQENGVWVLNEIPDYGEQLARCQRYFYRWPYLVQYMTLSANGGYGMADFQFPVTMRTIPTITNIKGTNTDLSTFNFAAAQGGVHFQNTGTNMVSITNFDAVADL